MIWLGVALPKLALLLVGSWISLIALHRRRAEQVRVVVPSLLAFARWPLHGGERTRFSRPRNAKALALHLLMALLLVVALGDPRVRAHAAPEHTVIVLDVSASMQAVDVLPNRLEAAKGRALAVIASMRAEDQSMVVVAGADISPAGPFTSDKGALARAVNGAVATDAPTSLEAAVAYAFDVLRGRSDPSVILFSDGQVRDESALERLRPEGARFRYEAVGRSRANVGITRCAARWNPFDRDHFELLLELRNAGGERADVGLRVLADGEVIDAVDVSLGPNETQTRVTRDLSGARERLVAEITPRDGADYLPVDNRAYATLPPRRRARVLEVSREDRFLDTALRTDPTLDVVTIAPEDYEANPPRGGFDLVVLDSVSVPAPVPAAALYIVPQGAGAPLRLGAAIANPGFDSWDKTHVALRHMDLGPTNIKSARALIPSDADLVLGASGAERAPLLVAGVRNGYRFLALGFDVRESDLPLRPAFPLLIAGAVRFLLDATDDFSSGIRTGERSAALASAVASGATIDWEGAEGARSVGVPHQAAFAPTRAGFYRLRPPDAGAGDPPKGELLAVNLADEKESAIGPASAFAVPGATSLAPRFDRGRTPTELWPLIVAAVGLLALIDWVWAHRAVEA